ncbi:hypothetical protein MGYG_04169 [Nannizzia gypsea CBS 118893]|uniref:Uncharacterized protein n=1 Tax=Arthroderma gypseum (strain ATCC MYA-4604 / CBS 118893) TaxID=535722 RepID=E4UV48_ARTGP|nr:hypothetical protein MGYG_04169 [Nannizzia gypsea CBS 118893]EFR01165.1 hypothetical protein MGYG_04169 [Nannizzia gypsea CBS 118893]
MNPTCPNQQLDVEPRRTPKATKTTPYFIPGLSTRSLQDFLPLWLCADAQSSQKKPKMGGSHARPKRSLARGICTSGDHHRCSYEGLGSEKDNLCGYRGTRPPSLSALRFRVIFIPDQVRALIETFKPEL